MWTTIHLVGAFSATVLCLAASGCAVPGNGVGKVSLAAQLVTDDGSGVPNERVDVILEDRGGLLWESSEPEGDQHVRLTTDAAGRFTHSFHPTPYSKIFWLLPPLGGFPRRPPDPVFLLRLSRDPDRYYEFVVAKDKAEYKVFDRRQDLLVADEGEKPLVLRGHLDAADERDGTQGWAAQLRIQFLSPLPETGAPPETAPDAVRRENLR